MSAETSITPVKTAYLDAASENECQNRLVMQALPQVYYIARRIHDRLPQHVSFDDLVHAGVLGLIEALRKYDAGKNVQFRSFAQFRIRGAILDSLRQLDWGSRRLRRKARSIEQATEKLAAKLGRQPDEEEIAVELGIPLAALHRLLGHLDGLELRGQLVTSDRNRSETFDLIEAAPAPAEKNPFDECLRGEMKRSLAQVISTLSAKEQQVISLYYREELTMKEIATVLDVVDSRVSQLHTAALAKLRTALVAESAEGAQQSAKPYLPLSQPGG